MQVYHSTKPMSVLQFHMRRLEQLCVLYLEATINHRNVLEALHNASHLQLYFIKEFCLKFIVKETNYNQIVMSKEFETLEQPLMVEIIRRQQMPQIRSLPEPQFDSTGCYNSSLFTQFFWIFICLIYRT